MKVDINNIFDNLDLQNTEHIVKQNIVMDCDNDMTESVKANTLSKLKLNDNSRLSVRKKKKHFTFKGLIAIAAAVIIVCGSLSVGATVHFMPDSALAEYLTVDDTIDLSTMGQNVDITATSSGYTLRMKQIISDNSTIHLIFDCPVQDGKMLVPFSINDIKINNHFYKDGWGLNGHILDENSFALVIHDLRNIKNNDKITIVFDRISEFYKLDNKIDGQWEFEFNAVRADVKTRFEPSTETFKDVYGYEYKINKMTASPLGIYIDYRQINGTSSDPVNENYAEFAKEGGADVTVTMKDGTVYSDSADNYSLDVVKSGSSVLGLPYKGSMSISFYEVIDVYEIDSIALGSDIIYKA